MGGRLGIAEKDSARWHYGVSSGTNPSSPEKQCDPDHKERIGRYAAAEMKEEGRKPKCEQQPKSEPENGQAHVQHLAVNRLPPANTVWRSPRGTGGSARIKSNRRS